MQILGDSDLPRDESVAGVRNLVQGMGGSLRHGKPASGGASFVLSF
jgi:hypothetical protein